MSDLPRNQFLTGNAVNVLKSLPDNSIHAVVTSPPYFGLRSYCEEGSLEKQHEIGIESSPEQYIESLVNVFREVKRVLHPSGTVWINIGDSYNSGTQFNKHSGLGDADRYAEQETKEWAGHRKLVSNLKPKDLIGIPWMLAFALRADGWYLRADILWSKSQVMPESITDRPTKSHEYIFLLTKNLKYYYDHRAIMEPCVSSASDVKKMMEQRTRIGGRHITLDDPFSKASSATNIGNKRGVGGDLRKDGLYRNKRSVWVTNTASCREAHFAVFPIALIEPMILAGTSAKGCCPKCGAPWRRVIEKTDIENAPFKGSAFDKGKTGITQGDRVQKGPRFVNKEIGWEPTCACGETNTVPAVILDPFMGAGTTAICARKNNRDFIGIDLNPKYVELAQRRYRRLVGQGIHNEANSNASTEKLDDLFSDLI